MNSTVDHYPQTGVVAAVELNSNELARLEVGQSLSIGSDPGCDIPLTGEGIAATHCMLISNGHNLVLRDCFSKTGTFIDGQRIDEARLETGRTTLRIGDRELSVNLASDASRPVRDSPESTGSSDLELELQLQAANNEIQILTERIARTKAKPETQPEDDPFHDEMIQLLQTEIAELQRALIEQTAACPLSQTDDESTAQPSPGETELLVGRLEQLLDELQQKDEQVALLHSLLETAEEANRAEQEEREQLNAWVPDIEKRFAEREREWQAQYEKLEAENLRIAEERDRAEAAAIADTDDAKLEAVQRLANDLRREAESLRQQRDKTETENEHLRREIEAVEASVSREEVVRLAQERAELARMRHELEAQAQADDNKSSRAAQSVDTNIRVLRQHLMEVHEQEKLEREQRSLSNRIAGLWKRIDGR